MRRHRLRSAAHAVGLWSDLLHARRGAKAKARVIASTQSASADALWWGLLLVFGIVLLSAAVFALRRWFFSSRQQPTEPTWSLQHLRDLRARGEITEAEFQRLRDQLLEQAESRKDRPATDAQGENAP